jgi:hypothetical protein
MSTAEGGKQIPIGRQYLPAFTEQKKAQTYLQENIQE